MKPKHGDLKLWWVPQVPMKSFEVPIASIEEGKKILSVLTAYDEFQFQNKIKPDYCNVGGLSIWDEDCPDEDGDCWISVDEDDCDDL